MIGLTKPVMCRICINYKKMHIITRYLGSKIHIVLRIYYFHLIEYRNKIKNPIWVETIKSLANLHIRNITFLTVD